MKSEKHSYKLVYKTLPALMIVFTIHPCLMSQSSSADNRSTSQPEVGRDSFSERFREGRDLIDKQEWARAAEKFRQAIEKYPDQKSADAALYWLAFCYQKQKKFKEANGVLDRLLEQFPSSSWVGDAGVMKMEIAAPLARLSASDTVNRNIKLNNNPPPGRFSPDLQANIIKGRIDKSGQDMTIAELLRSNERVTLDRADEIKIAAFQSLLIADPKRAIETMGQILKPDSQASETLKQEILRIWRNPRLFASQVLISNIIKSIGGKEFTSLLRETLIKALQNETNPKIQKEIIYSLALLADNQTTHYLKELYAGENDREIKKAIINSFGNSENGFYAFNAALKEEMADLDISRQQSRRVGFDALLEIVRTEKDSELRRLAFSGLQRFQTWLATEQTADTITRLYDAETDEEFKISIVRSLAESKQASATRKLLDIAKNDRSDKLRLEAIYSLRTTKDPKVLKFLEDLIK